MMESPRFAVMIPTWNEAEGIRSCLGGVLRQSVRPCQIVICDQGSSDSTVQVATNFLDGSGIRVDVVQERREPLLGKWNISRAYWRASQELLPNLDFVACLEADVVLEPDYYAKVLHAFSGPRIGLACGSLRPWGFPESPFPLPPEWREKITWGANRVYRNSCWRDLSQTVDLRLLAAWDTDHNVLAALKGWQIVQVDDAVSHSLRGVNPHRGFAKGLADSYQGYPLWFVLMKAAKDRGDLRRLVGYGWMTFWGLKSPLSRVYRDGIYARFQRQVHEAASGGDA